MVPAKATHLVLDLGRATRAAGLPPLSPPADLVARGRTQIAMRALLRIKQQQQQQQQCPPSGGAGGDEQYLAALAYLFRAFWVLDRDLTTAGAVEQALREAPAGLGLGDGDGYGDARPRLFTPERAAEVVRGAGARECKDALRRNTEGALRRGAFGCPWFWVADGRGREEPFFGSDRSVLSFPLPPGSSRCFLYDAYVFVFPLSPRPAARQPVLVK